jgi:hypothetical protein
LHIAGIAEVVGFRDEPLAPLGEEVPDVEVRGAARTIGKNLYSMLRSATSASAVPGY